MGCAVHLYTHPSEIKYEGEVLYKGWRDKPTRLWRINIAPDSDGNRLTPIFDEEEVKGPNVIMATIHWSINSIYECDNLE